MNSLLPVGAATDFLIRDARRLQDELNNENKSQVLEFKFPFATRDKIATREEFRKTYLAALAELKQWVVSNNALIENMKWVETYAPDSPLDGPKLELHIFYRKLITTNE